MNFADLVKETSTSTATDVIVLGGAVSGNVTFASAFDIGTTDIPVYFRSGNLWVWGLYTLTDATHLTRQGAIRGSSNDGAAVAFPAGAKEVSNDVPAEFLNGVSLADYLAANSGSTLKTTDTALAVQGLSVVGKPWSEVAALVNGEQWKTRRPFIEIETTAQVTLDATVHMGKRLDFYAAAPIAAPGNYASVGDGFECDAENLSGSDISLVGITVKPSGTVFPAGTAAKVVARRGGLSIRITGLASVSSTTPAPTINVTTPPAQTAGVAFTLAGTYANGTPAALDYSLDNGATWPAAPAPQINGGNYSFSLTIANPNPTQTVKVRDHGAPTVIGTSGSFAVNAAAGGGTGGTAPFVVTSLAVSGMPTANPSYGGGGSQNVNCYTKIHPTGTATVASVEFYLSTSNSVHPDPAIGEATSPKGKKMTTGGGGNETYYTFDFPLGYSVVNPTNFTPWVKVVDNAGATWWFKRNTPISIGDSVAHVDLGADEVLVVA